MNTGTNTSIISGVVSDVTNIMEMRLYIQKNTSLSLSGIGSSSASKSLLNRFIIRPDGVDSKNFMLLRNIEFNNVLCICLTARIDINVKNDSPNNEKVHWAKPSSIYTVRRYAFELTFGFGMRLFSTVQSLSHTIELIDATCIRK